MLSQSLSYTVLQLVCKIDMKCQIGIIFVQINFYELSFYYKLHSFITQPRVFYLAYTSCSYLGMSNVAVVNPFYFYCNFIVYFLFVLCCSNLKHLLIFGSFLVDCLLWFALSFYWFNPVLYQTTGSVRE